MDNILVMENNLVIQYALTQNHILAKVLIFQNCLEQMGQRQSYITPRPVASTTYQDIFVQRTQASCPAPHARPSPRKGSAQCTRMNYTTCYGPLSNSCCHKGPQGAACETRPLAPVQLDRQPQPTWTHTAHHAARGPKYLHAQSRALPRVTLKGLRRCCAAGQHQPALWVLLFPDTGLSQLPANGHLPVVSHKHPTPAPCHCHGYPQQVVRRVDQPILGPARKLGGSRHLLLWQANRQQYFKLLPGCITVRSETLTMMHLTGFDWAVAGMRVG